MKNKLISLLQELLIETDEINKVSIKASIMQNTKFLAKSSTFGELSNLMKHVNAYMESSIDANKVNIEKVIDRINEKF